MKAYSGIAENKRTLNSLPVITDILVIIGIFLILSGIFLSLLPLVGGSDGTLSRAGNMIKEKHPDWSNTICNAVAEHQIRDGMTQDQVVQSWGWPYKVNKVTAANEKEVEEWIMTNKDNSERLYFQNGLLQRTEK